VLVNVINEEDPAERSGMPAAISPAGDAYVFGGVIDQAQSETYTDAVHKFRTSSVFEPAGALLPDSGKAYMPAVWVELPGESRVYLFWGKEDYSVISDCITIYKPGPTPTLDCDDTGAEWKRWGASAVYDGERWIYLFGGATDSPGTGGTKTILRVDIIAHPDDPGAWLEDLGESLPGDELFRLTIGSAAVWNSADDVAYVVGANVGWGYVNRDIVEFDPSQGAGLKVRKITELPAVVDGKQGPSWLLSATYDPSEHLVLIFGGGTVNDCSGCEWFHNTIFRFDPVTEALKLDCLRLPSDREGTAAVWRAVDGASIVFGGAIGDHVSGGTTFSAVKEVVRYVA
jgi:hypothetical protein